MKENECYSIVKIETFYRFKNTGKTRKFAAFRNEYMRKRYANDGEKMAKQFGTEIIQVYFNDFQVKMLLKSPNYDDMVLMIKRLNAGFTRAFVTELEGVKYCRYVLHFEDPEVARKNFIWTSMQWTKL